MKFNYQARNKEGEISTGQIEASSKEAAIAFLQKRELYITFLKTEKGETKKEKEKKSFSKKIESIEIFGRTSRKDVVLFSRQLSIMFRSKVPLIEALRAFSVQIPNPNFREKILKISQEVEAGTSFSKALALYPKIFSHFYIAMIKSGEASGKLFESLDYLAEHLEREYHLTAKAKGAMVYPILVLLVIFVVLGIMVFVIIPQISGVLEGLGRELPLITRIVLNITENIKEWGFLMVGFVISIVILSVYYKQTEKGRYFFDNLWFKIPIIGNVLKMIYVARFAENLSTLITGGLPITRALAVTSDIINNVVYKMVILKIQEAVKRGETISSVLFNYPKLFPPVFIQMVLVGERTGTLGTTLLNIVSFYQKEVDRMVDGALSLLEPALIIFLGIVVGGVVVAILLPLYEGLGV